MVLFAFFMSISSVIRSFIFEVSDRIHVQRRGQCAGVVKTAESTVQDVLGMIVGAEEAA